MIAWIQGACRGVATLGALRGEVKRSESLGLKCRERGLWSVSSEKIVDNGVQDCVRRRNYCPTELQGT